MITSSAPLHLIFHTDQTNNDKTDNRRFRSAGENTGVELRSLYYHVTEYSRRAEYENPRCQHISYLTIVMLIWADLHVIYTKALGTRLAATPITNN